MHNSLHSTCARLGVLFVLSSDTYLPSRKCGEHYFFVCLVYINPQEPIFERPLLFYSLPSVILVLHLVSELQVPQQHQPMP